MFDGGSFYYLGAHVVLRVVRYLLLGGWPASVVFRTSLAVHYGVIVAWA